MFQSIGICELSFQFVLCCKLTSPTSSKLSSMISSMDFFIFAMLDSPGALASALEHRTMTSGSLRKMALSWHTLKASEIGLGESREPRMQTASVLYRQRFKYHTTRASQVVPALDRLACVRLPLPVSLKISESESPSLRMSAFLGLFPIKDRILACRVFH